MLPRIEKDLNYATSTIWKKVSTPNFKNVPLFLLQRFRGNYDIYHTVAQRVSPYLRTRYLRIHPKQWRSYIAMRVELYGCRYNGKLTIHTCQEPVARLLLGSWQRPPLYRGHIFLCQLGDFLIFKRPNSGQLTLSQGNRRRDVQLQFCFKEVGCRGTGTNIWLF